MRDQRDLRGEDLLGQVVSLTILCSLASYENEELAFSLRVISSNPAGCAAKRPAKWEKNESGTKAGTLR